MRIRPAVQNAVTYLTVLGVGAAVLAVTTDRLGAVGVTIGVVLCVPLWVLIRQGMEWLNMVVSRRSRDRRWLCGPEGRRWLTTTEGRNWRREQSRAKGHHHAA